MNINKPQKAQNLVCKLLRILTPEEVSELTTIFSSSERMSLSKLLKNRFERGYLAKNSITLPTEKDVINALYNSNIQECRL